MSNDLDDGIDIEFKPLDLEIVRKNIPTYSSQKLCEMIICDRYFGCYRDIAVMCMEELAARRASGDMFDFETQIEKGLLGLPKLNLKNMDIRDVLGQMINQKVSK